MNDPMQLPDDLDSFAKQLEVFAAQSRLNRDEVMFAAGQHGAVVTAPVVGRSGTSVRYWQAATAAMTLLSVGLGSAVAFRPAPETRVVVVERYLPSPPQSPAQRASDSSDRHDKSAVVIEDLARDQSPGEVLPLDSELASAWKARQAWIEGSGQAESPDAVAVNQRRASWRDDFGSFGERPLTGASLLSGGSRDAVNRWLEERL